uniref:Uncharacterized protein n=1 Tax=Rhizophora mucronata TaxID=61149 RepID=A0A2P2PWB0_RHIMU
MRAKKKIMQIRTHLSKPGGQCATVGRRTLSSRN